jgi:hypothetical protein
MPPPLQPDLPPSQAVPRNRWKICRESQGSGQDGGSGFVSLAHLPAEQSTFESCHPLTDLCWLTPQDLPASSWHCSLGKNREGVSNTPIERHGSNEQLGTAFTPIENHLTEVSPVECTLSPPLCICRTFWVWQGAIPRGNVVREPAIRRSNRAGPALPEM